MVFYPLQNHEKCCKWSVFHSLLLLKKCKISPAWVCLCLWCRGRFWLVLLVSDALVCMMRFPNHLVTGVFRWSALLSFLLLSQYWKVKFWTINLRCIKQDWIHLCLRSSLVAQMVKRLSIMRETWVWSLGREDPLEKEMAIHSSTIAWKIPWTEEPGRLQSMGSQRVGQDGATSRSLPGSLVPTVCLCFSSQMEEGCMQRCPEMQAVIDKKIKFLLQH